MRTRSGHFYQVATVLRSGPHDRVVLTSLGVSPTPGPGVLTQRAYLKRAQLRLAVSLFCYPAAEYEDTLGHGMGGGQQRLLQVETTSSSSRGRTTTVTFFLGQVQ